MVKGKTKLWIEKVRSQYTGQPFIDLQDKDGKAKPYQVKQVLEILDTFGFPKE